MFELSLRQLFLEAEISTRLFWELWIHCIKTYFMNIMSCKIKCKYVKCHCEWNFCNETLLSQILKEWKNSRKLSEAFLNYWEEKNACKYKPNGINVWKLNCLKTNSVMYNETIEKNSLFPYQFQIWKKYLAFRAKFLLSSKLW